MRRTWSTAAAAFTDHIPTLRRRSACVLAFHALRCVASAAVPHPLSPTRAYSPGPSSPLPSPADAAGCLLNQVEPPGEFTGKGLLAVEFAHLMGEDRSWASVGFLRHDSQLPTPTGVPLRFSAEVRAGRHACVCACVCVCVCVCAYVGGFA